MLPRFLYPAEKDTPKTTSLIVRPLLGSHERHGNCQDTRSIRMAQLLRYKSTHTYTKRLLIKLHIVTFVKLKYYIMHESIFFLLA